MAFTEQNKADAYLFFALAFNAAPGKQFGAQIVQAYEAGMTTADIVAQYVTKPEFLKLYPAAQTTKEFATALVTNVAAASTSVAAKNAAIADIEKAIAAGWTKDQVIVQVLGNLATKPVTDLDWGTTKAQLDNKIAVAKVLTEGDKALDTTDAALLQGPLKGVTEDAATVAAALDKSSVLSTKLNNLAAATKAKSDFATALDLTADGKADGYTSATVNTAVTAAVEAKGDLVETTVPKFSTKTKDVQEAIIASKKSTATANVADKAALLAAAKVTATTTGTTVTEAEIATYKAFNSAVTAAAKVQVAAFADQDAAVALATGLAPSPTVVVFATTGVASKVTYGASDVATYDTVTKQFKVDDVELAKITDAAINKAVVAAITAGNANIKAIAAVTAAETALINANLGVTAGVAAVYTTDGKLTTAAVPTKAGKAVTIDTYLTAETALTDAQQAVVKLDKTIAEYKAVLATKDKLDGLDKAIETASKAFTDAGLPVPVEAKAGLVVATGQDDTFLPSGETSTISGFNLVGKDSIYVGSSYVLNSTGDLAKGDNAALEVFFKANGADTDVYLEQKAFGSGVNGAAAGTKDIFKITLTGVAADKLALKDGFVVAA